MVGTVMLAALFSPKLSPISNLAETWFNILAAVAFLLGGTSLFVHHVRKVNQQEAGWGFSLVTLVAFLLTLLAGLLKWGSPPAEQTPEYAWSGSYQAEGSVLWWLYTYTMQPITASMFALLAFYVASAAFRAFRAKSLEAGILLVTAIIILLDRSGDGTWLTAGLPPAASGLTISSLTVTIMGTFNTAGQRAIIIGIALGVAATSLRILLGLDRSYLGSDD